MEHYAYCVFEKFHCVAWNNTQFSLLRRTLICDSVLWKYCNSVCLWMDFQILFLLFNYCFNYYNLFDCPSSFLEAAGVGEGGWRSTWFGGLPSTRPVGALVVDFFWAKKNITIVNHDGFMSGRGGGLLFFQRLIAMTLTERSVLLQRLKQGIINNMLNNFIGNSYSDNSFRTELTIFTKMAKFSIVISKHERINKTERWANLLGGRNVFLNLICTYQYKTYQYIFDKLPLDVRRSSSIETFKLKLKLFCL